MRREMFKDGLSAMASVAEVDSSQRDRGTEGVQVLDMIWRRLRWGRAGRSLFFARWPAESTKWAGVPCIDYFEPERADGQTMFLMDD